jgi:hypothetical protein
MRDININDGAEEYGQPQSHSYSSQQDQVGISSLLFLLACGP